MSDPFLGEIRLFGFNLAGDAPEGWALCRGQLLPISENTELFSLLGYRFGGSGGAFAVPNFQGNAACGQGQGPGLSPREVGDKFGETEVTVLTTQMPAHTHTVNVYNPHQAGQPHGAPVAGDAVVAPIDTTPFTGSAVTNTAFANGAVGESGGDLPHANSQPYLALNFCIALFGYSPGQP